MTARPPAGGPPAGDPPEAPGPSGPPNAPSCPPWATATAHLLYDGGAGPRVVALGAATAPVGQALVRLAPATRVTAAADGDVLVVELPAGSHDLVVGVHLGARHDEPTNADLVRRAARWLVAGGTFALVELLADERGAVADHAGAPPLPHAHPFSAHAGWLRQAGCQQIERFALAGSPLTLVRAQRPPPDLHPEPERT